MRCYAITEGLGVERALAYATHNLQRGVELIQIREKVLDDHDLLSLVQRIMLLPNPHGTRILVNGRTDPAITCHAHGVHLPATAGLPPPAAREQTVGLIGVSCHTQAEVEAAATAGADFVVFGPVFATPGKTPTGLDALRRAAQAHIPVFALGGVTWENAAACITAGAAGIAGIRLFCP